MTVFKTIFGGYASGDEDSDPVPQELKAKNKIDGISKNSDDILKKLSMDIESGDVHTYIFYYWKDCGHCKSSYKHWKDFEDAVREKSSDKYSVYAIEQAGADGLSSELLNDIGGQANGFPTFRYVYARKSQDYNGERDVGSLKDWMRETSEGKQSGGKRCRHNKGKKSCKHCKSSSRSRKRTRSLKSKRANKKTARKRKRKTSRRSSNRKHRR